MPFSAITRESLQILDQSYRLPDVSPGSMAPGRGGQAAPADPTYGCQDDFLRVLPIHDLESHALSRVYVAQVEGALEEPDFTARNGGTPWVPGQAFEFGQNLTFTASNFKTLTEVVRVDAGMAPDMRSAQVMLGKIALLRSLTESLLGPAPASLDFREPASLQFFIPANSPQIVKYDKLKRRRGGFAEMLARVRPGGDGLGCGPDAVFTSSRVIWGLTHEIEALGGTPIFKRSHLSGRNHLHYFDVPIMEARVPETSAGTVAYAACLTGESAVRLFVKGGDEFGVEIGNETSVTTFNNKGEATGSTSGVQISVTCALLVPDMRSIAMLTNIPLDPA